MLGKQLPSDNEDSIASFLAWSFGSLSKKSPRLRLTPNVSRDISDYLFAGAQMTDRWESPLVENDDIIVRVNVQTEASNGVSQ